MNRILVTGMALGAEPEIDACQVCDYDLSWLFHKPSTLLWADKIILSPKIIETIKDKHYPDDNINKLGEAIHVIFENLDNFGLIETKNPADVISISVRDNIYDAIDKDRNLLKETFPETIKAGDDKKVPGSLFIEDAEYCTPVLWSLYASLILSHEWKANILYQDRAYNYFKYKFGINPESMISQGEKHKAFDEILSVFVPETGLLPNVWYDPKCKTCKMEKGCESSALKEIDKNIKLLLEWRDYDEMHEIRTIISQVAEVKDDRAIVPADEIVARFEKTERKLKRKVHLTFPKIQHWSNIITILSLPVVVAGVSTGSATISAVGGGIGGLATLTNKYIEIMKSKYRWLGFRSEAQTRKSTVPNKAFKRDAAKIHRAP